MILSLMLTNLVSLSFKQHPTHHLNWDIAVRNVRWINTDSLEGLRVSHSSVIG